MTGIEFQRALLTLGMGKGEFAKHIDVTPKTISFWSNSAKVPKLAERYLELLIYFKNLRDGMDEKAAG